MRRLRHLIYGHGGRVITVVFDIDGVLCDSEPYTREHMKKVKAIAGPCPEGENAWNYYGQFPELWEDYNPYDCPVITGYATLLRMLYIAGYYVVIITNRNDTPEKRGHTINWLDTNSLPFDELIMRQTDDDCLYDDFKINRIKELQDRLEIELAIDDHDGHCNAFRTIDTPFIHAHPDSVR